MIREFTRAALLAGGALVAASPLCAQRGGGDWTTAGFDAQRSSWVRGDAKISPDSLRKPDFQLVWKLKLKNEPRELNSLTPPALFDFYIGYRGFRSLGFVGGSSDHITTIDTDLARIEWEKGLAAAPQTSLARDARHRPDNVRILCPGGMTSTAARPTPTGYPAAGGRGFGRGGPAKSGVGEPFEGAVTLKERPFQFPAPAPTPTGAARRTAPPPNPFARSPQYVYALASDGKLHAMFVSNGEEPNPPIEFLRPDANARGLMVVDNTAYVATVNRCGGVEDGIWALSLESKKVTRWKADRGLAESAGFAVGPEGTLYVAAGGGELVALQPGTLAVKARFKADGTFTSSPVIFDHKGKDLIAVATGDGALSLFDTATLASGPLARTQTFSSADFAAGGLASWQDASGTRWLLAPAGGPVATGAGFATNGEVRSGAIVAFKLVEEGGDLALRPGWTSRDLVSPLAPAVVNGVVFALSGGEFRGAKATAAQRAQQSSRAVLYALDGATGKELWNSGGVIESFVHSGGLAAGGGRVYVGDHDGTQYAFGFPMEH